MFSFTFFGIDTVLFLMSKAAPGHHQVASIPNQYFLCSRNILIIVLIALSYQKIRKVH